MFKKTVQQGRIEHGPEAHITSYVEGLREARTPLAVFFNILPWYGNWASGQNARGY